MNNASQPIGVFDSGLGGLTILKALKELLPNEQFIYYGDTAHLPYGEKSADALRTYVSSISGFLKQKKCKLLVVACNSASTVLDQIENLPFASDQRIDVIKPIIDLLSEQKRFQRIGFIGTRKTINSALFQNGVASNRPDLEITARHTPLLVPLIEEGFVEERHLFPVFERYFKGFENLELIVPACTHYPIIYEQIEAYFKHEVKVLHTPKIIAEKVLRYLEENGIKNQRSTAPNEFHVSDLTESFQREAEMFLGSSLLLQKTEIH